MVWVFLALSLADPSASLRIGKGKLFLLRASDFRLRPPTFFSAEYFFWITPLAVNELFIDKKFNK